MHITAPKIARKTPAKIRKTPAKTRKRPQIQESGKFVETNLDVQVESKITGEKTGRRAMPMGNTAMTYHA